MAARTAQAFRLEAYTKAQEAAAFGTFRVRQSSLMHQRGFGDLFPFVADCLNMGLVLKKDRAGSAIIPNIATRIQGRPHAVYKDDAPRGGARDGQN